MIRLFYRYFLSFYELFSTTIWRSSKNCNRMIKQKKSWVLRKNMLLWRRNRVLSFACFEKTETEAFVSRACFPNVSQFCHTKSIVSFVSFCLQVKYASSIRQRHSVLRRNMEIFPCFNRFLLETVDCI